MARIRRLYCLVHNSSSLSPRLTASGCENSHQNRPIASELSRLAADSLTNLPSLRPLHHFTASTHYCELRECCKYHHRQLALGLRSNRVFVGPLSDHYGRADLHASHPCSPQTLKPPENPPLHYQHEAISALRRGDVLSAAQRTGCAGPLLVGAAFQTSWQPPRVGTCHKRSNRCQKLTATFSVLTGLPWQITETSAQRRHLVCFSLR